MKRKIKYIAFYSLEDEEHRQAAPSAISKIDYICNSLVKNGFQVELISPSWTNKTRGIYKGKSINLNNGATLVNFNTFGAKKKFPRVLKYLYSLIQLLIYLINNTKKHEQIIVYHSVILSFPLRLLKTFKKIKIILEVEEIYQDIHTMSKINRHSEYKIFEKADKFILSNDLFKEKVVIQKKPNVVLYGTYKKEKIIESSFEDNNIHVVYAGTFDPKKGGADIAIKTAKFLPPNYHLHIIGFGSNDQIMKVQKLIDEVSKDSYARVSYDGLLKGDEYTAFLQKCSIGLSTQKPEGIYNDTSFPSKILSYMGNGLRVVSTQIKAVKVSLVGKEIFYYNEYKPESIAEAIKSINYNSPYNSRRTIETLDMKFNDQINELLEK